MVPFRTFERFNLLFAMKSNVRVLTLSILSFFFLHHAVLAQDVEEFDQAVLQKVWNSNIKAIIDLDVDKIVSQTNFPLTGDWFAAYELWEASNEELQEAYTADPGVVFDEDLRNMLRQMTWEDIVVDELDGGTILSVPIYITFEEEGEVYEFATILEFADFGEEWLLVAIFFAG